MDIVKVRRDLISKDPICEGIYCKLQGRFIQWFLDVLIDSCSTDRDVITDIHSRYNVEFFKFQTSKVGEYYCDIFNGVDKHDLFLKLKKELRRKLFIVILNMGLLERALKDEFIKNFNDEKFIPNKEYVSQNKEIITFVLSWIFAEICFDDMHKPINKSDDTL